MHSSYLNEMDTKLILLETFCLFLIKLPFSEQKWSDACHGIHHPQCTNNLTCAKNKIMCISEVRYYQWHDDDGCNTCELSSPVDHHCCQRNTTRCYRLMDENTINELEENCTAVRVDKTCELPAGGSHQVNPPCNNSIGGVTASSVRSIQYTCATGNCPGRLTDGSMITTIGSLSTERCPVGLATSSRKPTTSLSTTDESSVVSTTTTASRQTTHILSSREQAPDTGTIAGGVVGALVLIGIAVAVVIFYRQRVYKGGRAKKMETSNVTDSSGRGKGTDRALAHIDYGFIESATQSEEHLHGYHQNYHDEHNLSELYARVNKEGKVFSISKETFLLANYDHVQVDSERFPVIQQGDYDHVILYNDADDANNLIATNHEDSSSLVDTYDKLDRLAPTKPDVTTEDMYNRLHQSTNRFAESHSTIDLGSSYDYACFFTDQGATKNQ